MPVRIVPCDAVPQPKHGTRAEEFLQAGFHRSPIHCGVPACLEQAGFSREDRPLPVAFDRTAFEDHARCDDLRAGSRSDTRTRGGVEFPRRVFASPGVIAPIDGDRRLRPAADPDRPVVADPGVVGRDAVEAD